MKHYKSVEFYRPLEIKEINHVVSTVAIGNPERHVRKASHRGSKQQ